MPIILLRLIVTTIISRNFYSAKIVVGTNMHSSTHTSNSHMHSGGYCRVHRDEEVESYSIYVGVKKGDELGW